jgi:hypothetical protein
MLGASPAPKMFGGMGPRTVAERFLSHSRHAKHRPHRQRVARNGTENQDLGRCHKLAMDHATDESVLGDFSGATFTHYGVQLRFFRSDGSTMASRNP